MRSLHNLNGGTLLHSRLNRISPVTPRISFAQDLNQVGPLQRAVVFHEVNGLAGAPHYLSILDWKRATDAADDALQVRVGVKAESSIVVEIPPVVVVLVLGEQ